MSDRTSGHPSSPSPMRPTTTRYRNVSSIRGEHSSSSRGFPLCLNILPMSDRTSCQPSSPSQVRPATTRRRRASPFAWPIPPIDVARDVPPLLERNFRRREALAAALGQEMENEIVYYCQVDSRREYSLLSPVRINGGVERTWSLAELFAFVSDLESEWHIQDSGRWHAPTPTPSIRTVFSISYVHFGHAKRPAHTRVV
jgi:hypothetical protein